MHATTFLLTNRQKGAIGKNDLYMKNLVTLRFMLVSLFAIMSMAVSADIIYSTGDGFRYKLDTEAKTAELAGYNGSATEVSISESVTYEGVVYSVTSLGRCCFNGCSSLTSINIPSSVTSLGVACFMGCSSLTSIVVDAGNSVYDSRENCNAVIETESNTMICGCAGTVIPSSVTSLGEGCFDGCSSLTSINIPSSVTSLGAYCFMGCSSLKTVTCEIPAPIGDNYIFSNTPINEATLYVPEASLNSYKTTFPWSDFGTILAIKSTGIETNTIGTSATVDAIYNLEGKRNGGIRSGMNILRMSNGTTRKIMK